MIIGIDLGTSNSLAAAWIDGEKVLIPNSFGEFSTPSIVSIDNGEIVVGEIAKQRMISDPEKTVSSFKRFMGTDKTFHLENNVYTPQELSSFVLRQLKMDAETFFNESVEEAIISVPAYFNDKQRYATKLAGELAGFKVERIINEPSAAALEYNLLKDIEKNALIFDFGGGTLDISIVDVFQNVIEILAISGNNHLGGDDIDVAILKDILAENKINEYDLSESHYNSLLEQVQKFKEKISDESLSTNFTIEGKKLTYESNIRKLVVTCADVLKKIKKPIVDAIRSAEMEITDIDEIIMVGGSSKIKMIQKYISSIMNKDPIVNDNCDLGIALGCAVAAGIKMRSEDIKDIVMTDVCPFSLGVDIHNANDYNKPLFSIIIPKNTILPTNRKEVYCSLYDQQSKIIFDIYQGEEYYAKENYKLGSMTIYIPMSKAGRETVDVIFGYDINGILNVKTRVHSNGSIRRKIFVENEIKLSTTEISEKIKMLDKIRYSKDDKLKDELVFARGKKLFRECLGFDKEMVEQYLDLYTNILKSQDSRLIAKKRKKINGLFTMLEEKLFLNETTTEDEFNSFLKKIDNDDDDDNNLMVDYE